MSDEIQEPEPAPTARGPRSPRSLVVEFFAPGRPVTQGSSRAFVVRGRGGARPRAAVTHDSPHLRQWRGVVAVAALQAGAQVLTREAAVSVGLVFVLGRPAGHLGTGRRVGRLRPSAPALPVGRVGDVDKLARGVLDALTGVCWVDDSQVVDLRARKIYGYSLGVHVRVTRGDGGGGR